MPASMPSRPPDCNCGITSDSASGVGITPIDFIGSICRGDAKVRTFIPFMSSSLGAGFLVRITVGEL